MRWDITRISTVLTGAALAGGIVLILLIMFNMRRETPVFSQEAMYAITGAVALAAGWGINKLNANTKGPRR